MFPPDMNNHDRAVVHACCKKLGLKSKSYGKGDQRRVHVTKPRSSSPRITRFVLPSLTARSR